MKNMIKVVVLGGGYGGSKVSGGARSAWWWLRVREKGIVHRREGKRKRERKRVQK